MDSNTNSTQKKSNNVLRKHTILTKPFLNITKVKVTIKERATTEARVSSTKAQKRYVEKLDHKSKVSFKNSHPITSNPTFKVRNDNPPLENIAEGEDINFIVVVSKINMMTSVSNWMVHSSATRHICVNKSAFTSYTSVKEGEKHLYLSHSKIISILGKEKGLLKLTSRKTLALNDVLYVPSIKVNLISITLHGKVGVKMSFEYDKIILTNKNNIFVGKGYCDQGLFYTQYFGMAAYVYHPSSTFTPHVYHSISFKLDENNFLVWQHQVLSTIKGLNFMHYLH